MHTITLRVAPALCPYTRGRHEMRSPATSVGDALRDLIGQHPELAPRLTAHDGHLRDAVQVHVGRMPLREFGGLQTALQAGDVVQVSVG